jgi:hypothetical protein
MLDDGDPYDVADALESNAGSTESKPEPCPDSISLRTMLDDGDPYDVADALESNRGSTESKPGTSPNEKENIIVGWDGPDDPV